MTLISEDTLLARHAHAADHELLGISRLEESSKVHDALAEGALDMRHGLASSMGDNGVAILGTIHNAPQVQWGQRALLAKRVRACSGA
jgi:hypothetical protein